MAPQATSRRRNGAATREKILVEALRLFARKGFDATSIKDISGAVGVADAALYRHFPSKEDIAGEVFNRHYGALADEIARIANKNLPFDDMLHALVQLLCNLYDRDPDVFAFILVNQHNHLRFVGQNSNVVEEISRIMHDCHAKGEIRIAEPNLAAAIALGAAIQPAIFLLYGRLSGSMTQRAETIESAIRSALRPDSKDN